MVPDQPVGRMPGVSQGNEDVGPARKEGPVVTVVDSSGWIEFFTEGPNARRYGRYLEDPSDLVTPTIVLYEVYKLIKRERTEEEALLAAAQIQKTRMVPL